MSKEAGEVFREFDIDADLFLSVSEFESLCTKYFNVINVNHEQIKLLMQYLNVVSDKMDEKTFSFLFNNCFLKYKEQKTACILVDIQNDFISGSLATRDCEAKEDYEKCVPNANKLLGMSFNEFYVSMDWHPKEHISFLDNIGNWALSRSSKISPKENVKLYDEVILINNKEEHVVQKMWPIHCVQNTDGAKLHSGLKLPNSSILVYKGTIVDVETYSAFGLEPKRANTGLSEKLAQSNISLLVVCGIATDICIFHTVMDALKLGYRVVLVTDACTGIRVADIASCKQQMAAAGVHLTTTDKVEALITGKEIPFAYLLSDVKRILKIV